jgi:hypothetical protein
MLFQEDQAAAVRGHKHQLQLVLVLLDKVTQAAVVQQMVRKGLQVAVAEPAQ